MSDDVATALGALVAELTREATAGSPAPRLLPYLGLEPPSGTGTHLLDGLWTRGIFRKYEHVLELGAGLGGRARWMVARLGCTVVGTSASEAEARAGADLTRRTAARGRVELVPARVEALPFREAAFTHVWAVEALPRFDDVPAVCAEAHRVLRPGGYLAVQELVARTGALAIAGWRFADVAARTAALRAAGFIEVVVREVGHDVAERAPRVLHARERLLRRLERSAALRALARERLALAAALAAGTIRVVQIDAQRAA